MVRFGITFYEFHGFIYKNLTGHFAQAGPADVIIALEAVEILLADSQFTVGGQVHVGYFVTGNCRFVFVG